MSGVAKEWDDEQNNDRRGYANQHEKCGISSHFRLSG